GPASAPGGLALARLCAADGLGGAAIGEFGRPEGGILGPLLLVGIICAVQSTVDSALHLAGVYATEDIVVRFRPNMSERSRLSLARTLTAIIGMACLAGAIYFVVGGGEFIVTLLHIWLGTLS